MSLFSDVTGMIGNTPLVELKRFARASGLNSKLFGKFEAANPAGSIKDRVANAMICEAEKDGKLTEGSVIIEPTSGNTGIALAAIGLSKGYKVVLTMPETMSVERRNLIKSYGAEIVLTDGSRGMKGAIEKAEELLQITPNSFMPQQFKNKANVEVHKKTTGPEIWRDLNGEVDILIAGVGTGGTITGVGEYLKNMDSKIKVIAVEPKSSAVISGGPAGPHRIQGIGAGFIPKIFNAKICDEVVKVTDESAFEMRKKLAMCEGLLVGISSGAALFAAVEVARREENSDKNIVVILPDTGERYLSM